MPIPNESVTPEAPEVEVVDLFKDSTIPKEIQDDPEIIAEMKSLKDSQKEQKEDVTPPEQPEESVEPAPETPPKDKEPIEKKEGEEEDSTYSFDEDITIDDIVFKKEILKDTPVEVLENVSRLQDKIKTLSAEKDAAKLRLEDPIIQDRLRRIEAGKGNEQYSSYGMSKETHKYLKEDLELTDEEVQKVYGQFKADVEDNVKLAVNTAIVEQDNKVKSQLAIEKGMETLFRIGEVVPEYAIKETNLEKLWSMGDKHPEWKAFSNGIGKIQTWLVEHGIKNYTEVSKFTPKSLYAMAAAEMGLPVAINTKERDRMIKQSERDKLLEIFRPKRVAKSMRSKTEGETTKQGASIDNEGGLDNKLLNDDAYVQGLLDNAKDEKEIFNIVNTLRSRM